MTHNTNPPKPTRPAQTPQDSLSQPKPTSRPYRDIEREALDKAIGIVQILREVSPSMTLNQALVFLEIAREDGVGNLMIRKKTGFVSAVFTNLVAALSPTSYHKKAGENVEGLDLVISTDSGDDGRAKNLHLTPKGKKISEKIINKINIL